MPAKTIQNYITQWLYDNGRSGQQVPSVLPRFNRRMHELEEEIVTFVNNDLYTEGLSIDLDAGVNTYPLPGGNSIEDDEPLIPQLKKILEVSVRYDDTQTMPLKCREFTRDNFNQPEKRYEIYQTTLSPLFGFNKKEIVIYPTPTVNVTDGLIVRYAKSAVDVELSTLEDELPFAWFYINTILVGMSVDLAKANKGVGSVEYKQATQDWIYAKNKCLGDLSDRYISITNYRNPDLISLM